jgi:hypothetical protein
VLLQDNLYTFQQVLSNEDEAQKLPGQWVAPMGSHVDGKGKKRPAQEIKDTNKKYVNVKKLRL